jgi:hypothetical protein
MMNQNAFQLSTEQQFQLQCLQQEFQSLDRDAIVQQLLDAMEQLMSRDNLIRDLMKKSIL